MDKYDRKIVAALLAVISVASVIALITVLGNVAFGVEKVEDKDAFSALILILVFVAGGAGFGAYEIVDDD